MTRIEAFIYRAGGAYSPIVRELGAYAYWIYKYRSLRGLGIAKSLRQTNWTHVWRQRGWDTYYVNLRMEERKEGKA